MTYADVGIYDGRWINDKRSIQGKMTYADGDVYDGNWFDDIR